MRKTVLWALLSVVFVISATALHAQIVDIDEVDKTPLEAKFHGGLIHMELCPSGTQIVGGEQNRIRVSYEDRDDSDVRVRIHVIDDQAVVYVGRCPHNSFRLTVEVPKKSNLNVRMFAGEMRLNGITGDKDVELHAGHLIMDVGSAADYGYVDASVLSGDLQASAFDVAKGGLFRSFERSGPGKYRLHAHVGAGQIELR